MPQGSPLIFTVSIHLTYFSLFTALLEGLTYGLVLSVLTGPIFFTILQVSIERGIRAGIAIVAGQWLSDFIYIGLAFWAAAFMRTLQDDPETKANLTFYLGTTGSIFLLILGLLLLLSKPKAGDSNKAPSNKSLLGFFGQGFLINTLTPFPIFFWISLMSACVGRDMSNANTLVLFLAVMVMVILTDFIKVYAANYIKRYLKDNMVLLIRRLAGLALAIFGIILFVRIFYYPDSI